MTKIYTVKKFTTGQEIHKLKLSDTKSIIWKVTTQAPRFVVMEDGKPVFSTNHLTGYKNIEMYALKSAAQQSADYYNR